MIFNLILVLVDITSWLILHPTFNVTLEVEVLSSGMLKFIFRLIHVYDIIINHFLISYLVHTCCHWVDLGILVYRTGILWYRSGNTSC
jgi:hypothetical protein